MAQTLFLQPGHNHAPESEEFKERHVILSAPLMNVMERVHEAGVPLSEMEFIDGNIEDVRAKVKAASRLAINLVGAPYIPEVIDVIEELPLGAQVILGGQVINSLSDAEFDRLFKFREDLRVYNGSIYKEIDAFFQAHEGFDIDTMPSEYQVSSVKIWEHLPDEYMQAYLSKPITFYLAQGCKFNCSFCVAPKGRPERYRNMSYVREELEWLTEKALSYDLNKFEIYLSNLDLFQTPDKFEEFVDLILELKETYDFDYQFRGLSTVISILDLESPSFLEKCQRAGLVEVGIGVDGATQAAWKSTGKPHLAKEKNKNGQDCIAAIEKIANAGITPEFLMVIGHELKSFKDSVIDLLGSVRFARDLMKKYNAKIHPYVVKDGIPDTKKWKQMREESSPEHEVFFQDPSRFANLDFAALATSDSHRNIFLRVLTNMVYWRLMTLVDQEHARVLIPNTPFWRAVMRMLGTSVKEWNSGNYDW